MNALFDIIASVGLWAAVFRIATPLIFGTLGALLSERAGVLNLGIEGIMTFGAMIGWLAVFKGADLWTGLLIAGLAGAIFGLIHAALTVTLGLSQHVAGLGVTLFASSFSYFVFRLVVPVAGTPLAGLAAPTGMELLRCVATARLLMPRTVVRLSAGRVSLSVAEQALCFVAGANSIFTGDQLLTTPNTEVGGGGLAEE